MTWISAIRAVLSQCKLDMRDILCREALKIEDDFYQVTFKEKKPLGIVLERANDWGLIKVKCISQSAVALDVCASYVFPSTCAYHQLSQNKDSSIQIGSALSFINDVSVILEDYKTTTDALAGWQPPLTLRFRRAPTMMGKVLSSMQ